MCILLDGVQEIITATSYKTSLLTMSEYGSGQVLCTIEKIQVALLNLSLQDQCY